MAEAIEEFLRTRVQKRKLSPGSARVYGVKLRMYARELGPDRSTASVKGKEWEEVCDRLWAAKDASTYNLARTAAISFLVYARTVAKWTQARPPATWETHEVKKNRGRALSRPQVGSLFDGKYPVRERALWALLYTSSERLDAVLSLNVADMDFAERRAPVKIKGGDTRYIHWEEWANELLREYVGDRTTGPVFLTDRRPWNWAKRPATDRGPCGRRYRLSADRARTVYARLTGRPKPHRLRHSRLTHLGEDGVSTPVLMAVSGHESVASLVIYSQPGPDSIGALMVEQQAKHLEDLMIPTSPRQVAAA
ncbi:tyrosine-type recombinase/integrase [Streptomyces sp. NPDC001999]